MAKSQKLLSKSENKFRQIVEIMDEGVWKLDEKFTTVYVNRRMADMLGYTPEEIIGRSQISFIAADEVPRQLKRTEERRQGKNGRFECRFVTKDGRIRWMQVSATPIMNPDGTFKGSFAMHSDITDRKLAEMEILRRNEELHAAYEQLTATEEEIRQNYDEMAKSQCLLRESERKYRNVVEESDRVHLTVPAGWHARICQRGLLPVFGLKSDEIIGTPVPPVIPEDDGLRIKKLLAALTGKPG